MTASTRLAVAALGLGALGLMHIRRLISPLRFAQAVAAGALGLWVWTLALLEAGHDG